MWSNWGFDRFPPFTSSPNIPGRFPVNLDVVTVQNFDTFLAKKFFVVSKHNPSWLFSTYTPCSIIITDICTLQVCVPTIYGKLYPRLICCPDHTVSLICLSPQSLLLRHLLKHLISSSVLRPVPHRRLCLWRPPPWTWSRPSHHSCWHTSPTLSPAISLKLILADLGPYRQKKAHLVS